MNFKISRYFYIQDSTCFIVYLYYLKVKNISLQTQLIVALIKKLSKIGNLQLNKQLKISTQHKIQQVFYLMELNHQCKINILTRLHSISSR